jgi:hypothetical protein
MRSGFSTSQIEPGKTFESAIENVLSVSLIVSQQIHEALPEALGLPFLALGIHGFLQLLAKLKSNEEVALVAMPARVNLHTVKQLIERK